MKDKQQGTRQERMKGKSQANGKKYARIVVTLAKVYAKKVARNQARKYETNVARNQAKNYARKGARKQGRKCA